MSLLALRRDEAPCWFTGQLQVHKVRTCLIEKETKYNMQLPGKYQAVLYQ